MDGRGGDVAAPRVKVIETSYVTIPDPSHFKSVVQSLTGAVVFCGDDEEIKPVERKRAPSVDRHVDGGSKELAFDSVEGKRQRCGGGGGASELMNVDSFKEELQRMLVPDSPPPEDQLEWLFNNDDRPSAL